MASRTLLKLLKLAREQDGPAQLQLGKHYLFGGDGVAPNREAALMWLARAADRGIADASLLMAQHMPPTHAADHDALLPHYETAARAGDVLGALHAGMVWQTRGGADSARRSRHFLELAAQAGNADAQVMLARMLDESDSPDKALADDLLVQAAQAGSDDAVVALAEKAWDRRDPQGLEAIRATAQSRGANWWYRLGIMLREAGSDEAHLAESAQWLMKASEAGLSEAQYEIGMMLAGFSPSVLRRNYKRAARLLETALADGVAPAGVALARLHDNPRFEGRNPTAAQEALMLSARLGLVEAKFELGLLLMKPLRRASHAPLDMLLGCARWLHEAALAGHPQARAALAKVADAAPQHDADTLDYQRNRIAAVAERQPLLAMRMKLMAALGLGKAEMLLIDPARADQGFCVAVGDEAGKRFRLVLIDTAEQRALLDESKRVLSEEADADSAEPYAARYRKLVNLAKRHDLDWGRFSG